jgi:hypothetical protein
MKKGRPISVWYSPADRQQVTKAAAAAGYWSLSAYVRDRSLLRPLRIQESDTTEKVLRTVLSLALERISPHERDQLIAILATVEMSDVIVNTKATSCKEVVAPGVDTKDGFIASCHIPSQLKV